MDKSGFLIARNRANDTFFTASSSYDRPRWISLTEATVYATPELAQLAMQKLLKYGAYEARLIPVPIVTEAVVIVPTNMSDIDSVDTEVTDTDKKTDDKTMTADEQIVPCEECDHIPCTCDEPSIEKSADKIYTVSTPQAHPYQITEVSEIKYSEPSKETTTFPVQFGNNDDKIKVPVEIMSALQKAIDEMKKSETQVRSDHPIINFYYAAHEALKTLKAHLDLGTVEGIKLAQIEMTKWETGITSYVPASVQKFLYLGGNKPSLNDIFSFKRDERKAIKEATNHLGEQTFKTFKGWKAACKIKMTNCRFEGNEEICEAVPEVGHWDGKTGTIYASANNKPQSSLDEAVNKILTDNKKKAREYLESQLVQAEKEYAELPSNPSTEKGAEAAEEMMDNINRLKICLKNLK